MEVAKGLRQQAATLRFKGSSPFLHLDSMRQRFIIVTLLGFLPFIILLLSHTFLPQGYSFSSIYKLIFLAPILLRKQWQSCSFFESIIQHVHFKPKNILSGIITGILLATLYGLVYIVSTHFLNFAPAVTALSEKLALTPLKIILVCIYIFILNSFLEEFFWRTFIFNELAKYHKLLAHIISGSGFALQHIVFFIGFFSTPILALAFAGLFAFSILMNYMFARWSDLTQIWIAHAIADTAQFMIGMHLFGII